jgi:hypothetical protein
MQRLTFPDERVQPLVRGVTRIHVVEEARHVRYAREELRRQMVTAPRWSQEFTRVTSGEFARIFSIAFVNPEVYTNVGLDRRRRWRRCGRVGIGGRSCRAGRRS